MVPILATAAAAFLGCRLRSGSAFPASWVGVVEASCSEEPAPFLKVDPFQVVGGA